MNAELDGDLRSPKAGSKTWALCHAPRAIPKWYLWPGTPVLLGQMGSSDYRRGHVGGQTLCQSSPFVQKITDPRVEQRTSKVWPAFNKQVGRRCTLAEQDIIC